jgi:AAA domain
MTETPEPSNTDPQQSQTNNHPKAHFQATLSALEKECGLLVKEIALMDKESAPEYKPKGRGQTIPTPTWRDTLTWAQQRTDTNHFPQLLPQEELSTEEITAFLAEHKASVDKLSRPFSVYKHVLDKARPRRIRWLWPKLLPLGGLTLLNGAHGTGRSLLVWTIAAAVSSGGLLPDGTSTKPGGVVIVAPYADAETLLYPLLSALGADVSRIRVISYIEEPAPEIHTGGFRPFSLPEDITSLSHAIEQVDARLVIMDPFMSLLSSDQRWTAERLRRLLTNLHQRMVEREVACILVRNCPGRFSHTRPSQLERSDHFENVAESLLLLAPDPIHPDCLLLSHADSNSSPLARTLTLQIQPLPDDPDFAHLTVVGSHPLRAHDLMEHRPDTLRRQLLADNLLSFILHSAAPIPVTQLYTHFSPASPFQIQRSLKDLLNTEQIERPSRGFSAPLHATVPTTGAQPLKDELTVTATTTLEPLPTNALTKPATTTSELPPTNELTQPAATTLEPLPTNELTEPAATTLEPLPTNELTEPAATTLELPPTNAFIEPAATTSESLPTKELTQPAATTLELPPTNAFIEPAATTSESLPTNAFIETATTTPEPLPKDELTEPATTTSEPLPTKELTEPAATTLELLPTNALTEPAATTSESLPTKELTEPAATTLEHPPTKELIESARTTSNHPLTNRNQEIAAFLSDPAFINRLKDYTATASDPHLREKLQKIVAVLSHPSFTNGPNEIAATLTGLPLMYAIVEITAQEPKSLLRQMVQEIAAFIGAPSPTNRLQEIAAILFNTPVDLKRSDAQ